MSKCSVCGRPYNDSTQLPLVTSCKHTHCLACIRQHTVASHPGLEASSESQVPTGREIECLKCRKVVNTDDLVIDRAALASVPLSLEDLIIADDSLKKPSDSPSKPKKKTAKNPAADFDPGPDAAHPGDSSTHPGPDCTPGDLEHSGGSKPSAYGLRKPSDQTTHRSGLDQENPGPHFGWTHPTSPPPDMDPHHPHQHHNTQPGVVGWAVAPGQPHPHAPHQPGAYSQMPQPYGHAPHSHGSHHSHGHATHSHGSHHSHGHAIAAGAAGVAAGVGVGAVATHAHKKKKDKKKHKEHKKEHKKGKGKTRHRSSSGSSNSSSSSSSSKSSKSSNSS